jgi:hypothetical protein
MATGIEKQRRMETRRRIGSRKLPVPIVPAAGPAYRVSYACFACRLSFKRTPRDEAVICPGCRGPAYEMGRAFKAPETTNRAQWRKVQALYAYGFRFAAYREKGAPTLPATYKDVARFVAEHPAHPYRVATPILDLLPMHQGTRRRGT